MLRFILESDEFASKVRHFLNAHVAPQRLPFLHDNSQNGEVTILLRALIERSGAPPYVFDVGAYGRSGSNSYDLMRHFGWRGLLVEPNERRHAMIEAEFRGLTIGWLRLPRPWRRELPLCISSIHRENTAFSGDIKGTLEVRAARLSTLLAEHDAPKEIGLLSIDCEGLGFDLLEDALARGYQPHWVIIEVHEGLKIESFEGLPISEATKAAYRIAGRTYANLLLERVVASSRQNASL